jgi:hypothetical protein
VYAPSHAAAKAGGEIAAVSASLKRCPDTKRGSALIGRLGSGNVFMTQGNIQGSRVRAVVRDEVELRMKKTNGKIISNKIKGNNDSDGNEQKGDGTEGASKSEITAKAITEVGLDMTVPIDFVEARKNVAALVRMAANEIAVGLIAQAKSGELAPAKYLFELAGLYPATPETSSKPENSLAYALLKRMGLPTDPVDAEEDDKPVLFSRAADPVMAVEAGVKGKCEGEFDRDREKDECESEI